MPEGPEIRRAADRVERAVAGRPADRVEFAFPHLARFGRQLSGCYVESVETRGKAMIVHFDAPISVYTHNQLYGRWYVTRAGQLPKTGRSLRFAIHNTDRSALLYSASEIQVWKTAELHQHPFLSRLGPDALSPELTDGALSRHMADPRFARRQLHALLLDQSFVAGIGNYLRSEVLFVAGLHPTLRPSDITGRQRLALARAIRRLTERSYRTGGITNDERRAKRLAAEGVRRGRYRHFVFTRGRLPCFECGTPIRRDVLAGRKIFFCPACQPGPGA